MNVHLSREGCGVEALLSRSQRLAWCLILSETVLYESVFGGPHRVKVLDAVDRGMPRAEVGRIFGISLPSIKRWLKRRRETGQQLGAKAPPGPPAIKAAMLEE